MVLAVLVLIPRRVGKESDSSLRLRMTRVSGFVAPIVLISILRQLHYPIA